MTKRTKRAGSLDGPPKEEDAFREQRALYGRLIEGLTEYAMFALSPTGMILTWNAGAQQTFGYTEAEVLGKPFELIFTLEDRSAGEPQKELDAARMGTARDHDRWHVRKDGTRFWGTNTIEQFFNASHVCVGFTKLVRDTTANHLALEKLTDSEQELRLLFESVKDYAIYSITLDGRIDTWNAGAVNLFGFEAPEIMGQNFSVLFSSQDKASNLPERELHDATINGSAVVERWMIRKDGTRFFGNGKLSQLKRDAAGQLRGFVKIAHDKSEEHAALEHERKWSATFQRAVLPASLPLITGLHCDATYRPGSGDAQVGGDWYDAVRLPDGRILIAIGDVAGHGLEAAVIVGVIRQIVRGIAQLHANPALILDTADQALSLEYPDVYVTAWIGILDQVMRTITYSCAGHPPALLKSADGSLRELDRANGLPIGLREGVLGLSETVPWCDGDALVLYTDGLIEAKRDILAGIASLRAAVNALSADSRLNSAEQLRLQLLPDGAPDDVAVLVLRVDFEAFEEKVDRWHLDALDAVAATDLRKKLIDSLPERHFSTVDTACAELVLGELVGNVVRHARGNFEADVAIDHSGARTVLHVLDGGAGFRYVGRLAPDPYSETGRGLFLIAAMTTDFQVDVRPEGGSHARAVLRDRSSVTVF